MEKLYLFSLLIVSLMMKPCECAIRVVEVKANELLKNKDELKVVDVRNRESREIEGYIQGSLLKKGPDEDNEIDLLTLNRTNNVVVVADDNFVDRINVNNGNDDVDNNYDDVDNNYDDVDNKDNEVLVYREGMHIWSALGGQVAFPKFIHFEALSKLLESNSVLLLDVRNRSELIDPGQIPKSVCVPLHEVKFAFDAAKMSSAEFEHRFNFARPAKDARDVVLTCRSGRRVLVADRIMKENFGYEKLRIYSGSFKDWRRKGGEIIRGELNLDYEILGKE